MLAVILVLVIDFFDSGLCVQTYIDCLVGEKFVCSHFVALDAVSDVLTGEQSVPLMPPMSTLWDNTTPHPFLVKRGQFSALIVFVLDVALMSTLSLW